MPTQTSTSRSLPSRRAAGRRSAPTKDALALLRADHKKVQRLFDQFAKARNAERKTQLATEICAELTVHARIEEEIFYPAAREVLRDEALIDEATVEHATAKDLIAAIEGGSAGDELFHAHVTVLGEYIKHHVKEEQNELFPKLRKSRLDLKMLGQALAERKEQLTEQA